MVETLNLEVTGVTGPEAQKRLALQALHAAAEYLYTSANARWTDADKSELEAAIRRVETVARIVT